MQSDRAGVLSEPLPIRVRSIRTNIIRTEGIYDLPNNDRDGPRDLTRQASAFINEEEASDDIVQLLETSN
jgi:hypothetical protein